MIQAVTSAAAFLQVTPPALPPVAPYDMISLFGGSFCISGGTGCTDNGALTSAGPATLRYPLSLSPDAPTRPAGADGRLPDARDSPVPIANAPLLFATNGQINALVPSAVSSYLGKTVDVVVSFGRLPTSRHVEQRAIPGAHRVGRPGGLTVESDGQGDGAILGLDWSLIAGDNPAALRSIPADSDTVQIYMTGLGAPDSTANNASAGGGQWPGGLRHCRQLPFRAQPPDGHCPGCGGRRAHRRSPC